MAIQGPMKVEQQENQLNKSKDIQSEYNELVGKFKNLGIEPKTQKPKNWTLFGEEVVTKAYVDSLAREYHNALLAQRTAQDIEKWQTVIHNPASEVDELFESLLEANKEQEYSILDSFTAAHNPQLTNEQLAVFEHSAMQGTNLEELQVIDGEFTGKFYEQDKNKVGAFKEQENSGFEYNRNPFAKNLLNQYKKVQAKAAEHLDKEAQAQQAGKDSFDDRVRYKPKV